MEYRRLFCTSPLKGQKVSLFFPLLLGLIVWFCLKGEESLNSLERSPTEKKKFEDLTPPSPKKSLEELAGEVCKVIITLLADRECLKVFICLLFASC